MILLFWICASLIMYTMIGYPLILEFLNKIVPTQKIVIDFSYKPKVTIIVPAHNEELVIEKKIKNLLNLNYPMELLEIIVASDNSTDRTNRIVQEYSIKNNTIILYEVKDRKGKTNAQNEAVQLAEGEILVMTDANSFLDSESINELVGYFSNKEIAYVAGRLTYTNSNNSLTSQSEATYWNLDLRMREIESSISSITAGNGSIYAVRKVDYINIDPIYSHDSVFPPKFVIQGKRAVYNPNAIAYEKAGETNEDEFQRKVRMSRKIIKINFIDLSKYNIFKYGYFSFFYFSHRFCRNNLYVFHILLYMSNFLLLFRGSLFFINCFILQTLFYLVAILFKKSKYKLLKLPYYYCMTIFAQFVGACNELTGKSKPFWEKAESTR